MGDYGSAGTGMLAGMGFMAFIIFALMIAVFVFYMLSLSRALRLAGAENRKMEPGLVWLNLIPVFNLGWIIYTVLKVSEAVTHKYAQNGTPEPSEGSKVLGLLYTIFALLAMIPFLGVLFGLASFVMWIIYWVKVSGYNTAMQAMASAGVSTQATESA